MRGPEVCWNCVSSKDVHRVSFTRDLPTVALCGICRIMIMTDREQFDQMGKHRKGSAMAKIEPETTDLDPRACPKCGADLRIGPYSRTIGIECRGIYDGVLFWACPDCRHGWHRWPESNEFMRAKATQELETWNART